MFTEWAGVISGNVIFTRETFFYAKEAGGGAITMGAAVFGATDITVIFVNGSEVRTSTLGASDEGFGSLAVRNGMAEAEAAAALNECRAAFKGSDGGFAAEEVRGRAAHEFEAITIRVVEGENDARMDFSGQVLFTAEPTRLGKKTTASTNLVFHKFCL
jgi:hypothetical protein